MGKTETNTIHPAAFLNQPVATPHQPRYAQQLFNYGMIAPGNHHFERFAALCNTPEEAKRHFVPAGRQSGDLSVQSAHMGRL